METVIFTENLEVAIKLSVQIKRLCRMDRICFFTEIENNISFLQDNTADIVFLDIENELTRWQNICKRILDINDKIKIVLLCNDSRYAVKAYEIGVFDYIIKPISDIRLTKLLNRIIDNEQQ